MEIHLIYATINIKIDVMQDSSKMRIFIKIYLILILHIDVSTTALQSLSVNGLYNLLTETRLGSFLIETSYAN